MELHSFNTDVAFDENRVQTKVIIETSFSKEIRILLAKGQLMKEHKAPFSIVIHILEGFINLGVNSNIHEMKTGDIITLEPNVPHDLFAHENSIIRLSLSKLDRVERVQEVVNAV